MQNNADGNASEITKAILTINGQESGGLMDCAQTAKYLNISESYVRKSIGRRSIPFVAIGTRKLFRRSDLDAWVAEHVISTDAAIASRAQFLSATLRMKGDRR